MANPTTNYGFVLPTPTDLVTNLPADFDVALQGVDTRLKALQPGTTLGDLAYSSATADTNTRLGIGSSGQLLTVTAGVPAWATPASGGKVLQVVSATTSTAVSSSTTSLVDTGLTASITPGVATSKVLVMVTQSCYKSAASANNGLRLNINRGASAIFATDYILFTGTAIELSTLVTSSFLDSPSTTSATTYKTQFSNRQAAAAVDVQPSSTTSTIILMEIGA